jgi:hypothetical protein
MSDSDLIAQVVAEFRAAAIAKGSDGHLPARQDHALHLEMARAVTVLRSAGNPGREALLSLARDPSPEVRAWAAAELLIRGDAEMVPVVEELAGLSGLLGFSASIVLEQYQAGRLQSPFGVAAP